MSIRDDILAGLRAAESGSVGDETPEQLLAEYDALKRAEVLFAVADFFEAAGDIQGRAAASKLREMAVAAHAKGGAR